MYKGFSDAYCPEVVDRIVTQSEPRNYETVFRRIDHASNIAMGAGDFMPSIMTRNHNVMPDYTIQKGKTKLSNFSCSFFETLDELQSLMKTIPSERTNVSIATGSIIKERGRSDCPAANGHINHFIFDPLSSNYWIDFRYIDSEDNDD